MSNDTETVDWSVYRKCNGTSEDTLYVSAGDPDEDDSLVIAEVYDQRDAPLISAAPGMKDALEAAEHWLQEERENPGQATPGEILRVIGAALAKARGDA